MSVLNIDNQTTVTNVASQRLNVTFSGTRLNILAVAGPQGPQGPQGPAGTGGAIPTNITGLFPLYYDQGSGAMGIVSGYYAQFSELTGASGALVAQIVAGAAGVIAVNGISGFVSIAGTGSLFTSVAGQRIIISGSGLAQSSDLIATGSTLYNLITNLSGVPFTGVTQAQLAATGALITSASGANAAALVQTGSSLYAILTGGSGQAVTDYATKTSLLSTGQQAWTAADTNARALSGALTATGVSLASSLAALSGALISTGGLLSSVRITGSISQPVVDFTGIGGVNVILSGNKVLISGGGSSVTDHGDGINLSGQLQTTGSNLYRLITGSSGYIVGLISAASAGVSSLNGASGVLTMQGAGNVSVSTVGQVITISGNTGDYATFALKTDLTATGANLQSQVNGLTNNLALTGSGLYAALTGMSGQASTDYATKTALTQTGVQLVASLVALSGIVGATGNILYTLMTGESGAFNTALAITGQQAWNAANSNGINLSGNLTQSGIQLIARDNTISGVIDTKITATGSAIYALITGMSGQDVNDYATKASLTLTGQTLQSRLDLISGNLIQTGVQLIARDSAISGALDVKIAATGNALYTVLTGMSGQGVADYATKALLASTGQQLSTSLTTLSGNLTATGAALSAVKVSGSSIIPIADFSGIGGTIVLYSGGKVFISGAGAFTVDHGDGINLSGQLQSTGSYLYRTLTGASGYIIGLISAASAGVASINGASGVLTLQGAGNVSVTTAGQTITVSGNTGDYALFATKVALTQSGVDILNALTAMSGAQEGIFVHRMGNESITGVKTFATAVNVDVGASYQQNKNTVFFTTGRSTYVGVSAGAAHPFEQNGAGNTFVGYQAGSSLLTGTSNIMIGLDAGMTLATGSSNVIVGDLAGQGLTVSSNNTLLGFQSAGALLTGDSNVIIGYFAGQFINTGGRNIIIGPSNAINLISGSRNIFIGDSNTFPGAPSSFDSVLDIGNVIFGTGINLGGNTIGAIGIGSSNPLSKLHVSGDIRAENGFMSGAIQLSDLLYPRTNPSGYITGGAAGTINGITGALITGTGIVSVSVAGGTIVVSGNTGDYALFAQKTDLTATGQTLQGRIDLISGNLIQTGVQLANRINSVGSTISGNLTATGQTLLGNVIATSGSLALTGQTLYSYITAISGFATGSSGSLDGRLTQTGVQLIGSLNALSGNLTATGAALSAVKVSGSAIIPTANFTGIGGTTVVYSGGFIFISGAVGAGGGVPSVNGITSAVTIAGTGNITVSTSASNIFVSGDTAISGALTQTGLQIGLVSGALATLLTITGQTLYGNILATSGNLAATGQQAWTTADANGRNLSGNLTQTGVQLQNLLTNSGALLSAVKVSGSNIINLANFTGIGSVSVVYSGGFVFVSGASSATGSTADAINLSGNLALTGSNLYNMLTGESGWLLNQPQVNLNGATGLLLNTVYYDNFGIDNRVLTITGGTPINSSFVGLLLNVTGVTTTVRFPSGYRLASNRTLISGLTFTSGSQGLNFTWSNNAWYIDDTASYLNNAATSRNPGSIDDVNSGYAIGSQWVNPATSGLYQCLDASPGAATWYLINGDAMISGLMATGLTNTGALLYSNDLNLSGSLTQTGLAIGALSGALATKLANTGAALSAVKVSGSSIISTADFTGIGSVSVVYSGGKVFVSGAASAAGSIADALNLSGSLTQTGIQLQTLLTNSGALLSAVKVTGSVIIPVANFTGLGGTLVFWSGNQIFISGAGAGAGGGVSQGQLDSLSGYGTATYATIPNLAQTGSDLQAQIRALTGLGTSLSFDLGRNIIVPSGTGSFPVSFSRDLAGTPFVIPVISNNSGDPVLACYPSGITNLGFTMVMSATVPTSGYRLNYLATTGSGWVVLGQNTGNGAASQSQIDALSGFAIARDLAISGVLDTKITATGSVLQSRIDLLSGQIIQTGLAIGLVSGALNTKIVATGTAAVGHANGIGSILSGNLTATGLQIGLVSGALFRAITGPSGYANINGEYIPAQTVSANYTVRVVDNRIYCNNTDPIILTFASAVAVSGQLVRVKLLNTGSAIFTGTFGQKFDAGDSFVLAGQYNTKELHSNGANWCIW